LAADSVP